MSQLADDTLNTGVSSPLARTPSQRRQDKRKKLEAEQDAVYVSAESIVKSRLKNIREKLEAARKVNYQKMTLPKLPTDYDDASLGARMQAHGMHIAFLEEEEAWHVKALERIKQNAE